MAQLRDRIEIHEGGSPQFRLGLWRQTWDTPSYKKSFEPPVEEEWAYKLPGSRKIVTDRAFSKSYMAILSGEDKASAKSDIEKLVDRGDDRIWIDEKEGLFEYPYKTYVVLSHKK